MKKLLLSISFLLGFAALNIAQTTESEEASRKRIEASKVAYMTSYLDLSTIEAEKFWPVYNEYQAKSKALREQWGKRKDYDQMTEAEASSMLDKYMDISAKRSTLKLDYMKRFRTILSDKKVLMLNRAESDFRKQVVKKYAERKRSNDNPNRD